MHCGNLVLLLPALVAAHGGVVHSGTFSNASATGTSSDNSTAADVDSVRADSSGTGVSGQTAIALSFFGMAATIVGASVPWAVAVGKRSFSTPADSAFLPDGPVVLLSNRFIASSFGFAGGALMFGTLFDVLPGSVEAFKADPAVLDTYAPLAAMASMLMGVFCFLVLELSIKYLAPDLDCPCHSIQDSGSDKGFLPSSDCKPSGNLKFSFQHISCCCILS